MNRALKNIWIETILRHFSRKKKLKSYTINSEEIKKRAAKAAPFHD